MGSWFCAVFSASRTATGGGQDEDRRPAHDAGSDHHLVEPVDVQTLLKVLAGVEAPPPPQQSCLLTAVWQRHQSGCRATEAAALNDVDQRVPGARNILAPVSLDHA